MTTQNKNDVQPHPGFVKLDVPDGTLYQPSNGTEGEIFWSFFCHRCIRHPISHDAKSQCQILGKTFQYSTTDPEYPTQWHYKNGQPLCSSFREREAEYQRRKQQRRERGVKTRARKHENLDLFTTEENQ